MSRLLGTLAVVGLVIVGTMPTMAQGAVKAGKALFLSHCAVCHRESGAGGLKVGTTVSADLRSPGLEITYHHSDALILRAILDGKDEEGGPLDAPMPHWRGALPRPEAEQILAYIKTLCCNPAPERLEKKGED